MEYDLLTVCDGFQTVQVSQWSTIYLQFVMGSTLYKCRDQFTGLVGSISTEKIEKLLCHVLYGTVKLETHWRMGGGGGKTVADLGGAHLACAPPPTVQNFLDFMQFFGKFDKIVCWRPQRVGAPSYRESWIRPWKRR